MQPATRINTAFGLGLSLLLALGGCSPWVGGGNAGEWYESGQHPDFPSPKFMVGVGYGDTMKDADDMARGELTKNFMAKVTTVSLETDSYKQRDTAQGSDAVRQFETRTFTRVKGMAVLEDVRIVDRVVAGARHYSLAVVDVQALRGKWARRLSGVDFAMESSLKAPGSAPADRIRAIAGALRRLAEKRSMEAQLRAIGGPLPPDTRDYAALFQEMQTLLKQVFPITLRSNDAEMTGLAAQALSDEWLVVAGAEQGVDAVVVDLQVTFRTQETASGVEILYTAQAEAVQNGHRLAGQNLADRLVHRDESTGKQKALLEIRDRLLKPFAAELSASILGDSPKEAGKEH